jgi:AbrB family looped-hinge helix DNA binding protein
VEVDTTTVTSQRQVTIPKDVRRRFGIRQGSRVEFNAVGDDVELRKGRVLRGLRTALWKRSRPPQTWQIGCGQRGSSSSKEIKGPEMAWLDYFVIEWVHASPTTRSLG